MAKADYFGATDQGRQRDNNEDAFLVQDAGGGLVLAGVIDGVGGYEGGEVAAAIAKKTIQDHFRAPAADPIMKMKTAFVQANEKIYEDRLRHPVRDSMACVLTLALADVVNNRFHYAHVGDTRLYLLRDRSLVKVTRDHSFVGFLEDNARISEEEAMNHLKRNEVNKALGYDPNMAGVADYIETGTSPFLPGDLLLLCSDGLSDLVTGGQMTAILTAGGTLAQKTKDLIDAANAAGGKDNITAVLVQNTNRPARQSATKPVAVRKSEPPAPPAPPPPAVPPAPRKKRGNGFTVFLLLLCLVLGAGLYYFWQKDRRDEQPAAAKHEAVLAGPAQRLSDSLQRSPFLFLDSSWDRTIVVGDTILVTQDSLYINGNGAVLQSDSSYRGPMMVTGANCKYVLLENLVIENFDIGLIAGSKALRLKNVVFLNCRLPVQYHFMLPPARALSGTLIDSLVFTSDSLKKRR